MGELQTYHGACHCGAVEFEVRAALDSVVACNCSICSRAGYLLTFVPEEQITLLKGQTAQTDYQFGKKHIHHLFCSTCGIRTFGQGLDQQGKMVYAVNARCLDGVDVSKLSIQHFDGKSL